MRLSYATRLVWALSVGILLSGCGGDITVNLPDGSDVTVPLPDLNPDTVRIEVYNDTDFDVDPRIQFDNDSSWLASLFPSEELATGTLEPGDLLRFTMDCDQVALVRSEGADQFLFDETIGQADSSRTLRIDEDYECGDVVQFHFIGSGDDFGVIVSVNDVVVD